MKKITVLEYNQSKNKPALLYNSLSYESSNLADKKLEEFKGKKYSNKYDKWFWKTFVTYLPDEDCYLIK